VSNGGSQYSADAIAAVGTGASKQAALDHALELTAFDRVIAAAAATGEPSVAIKPRLNGDGPCTDPELVELLVARLRQRGYERISVVETGDSVEERARELGYSGEGYAIADLGADPVDFEYGGVIGIAPAGRAWREAEIRISFAKNRTHNRLVYSGSMTNVIGTLPTQKELRREHALSDCCRTVLEALPLTFALVDAWDSADASGTSARRETHAVLASPNAFALDWLMGELMGVEPQLNPVVQEGLHRFGRIRVDRQGNLTPWDPWSNPPLAVVALAGLVGRSGSWSAQ
jgi:uncharacterized protein (DUF362 family)